MNHELPNIDGKEIIERYYHKTIEVQPMYKFFSWAFGSTPIQAKKIKIKAFEDWNKRHEELFLASKDDLFIPTVKRMIDAYKIHLDNQN